MKTDLLLKFGNRVRTRRLSLSLSQEELAARAGVHRTYVGMIERAEKNITLADGHLLFGMSGAPDSYTNFDMSPDGRRIAASHRDPKTGVNSLALIDVERGVTAPITPLDEDNFDDPTWAPDGRNISYRHADSLVMRAVNGGDERVLVTAEAYPDHFSKREDGS